MHFIVTKTDLFNLYNLEPVANFWKKIAITNIILPLHCSYLIKVEFNGNCAFMCKFTLMENLSVITSHIKN